MKTKDAASVSMILSALVRAMTYENKETQVNLALSGLKWANAKPGSKDENAAWREVESAAGWLGLFSDAEEDRT